MFNTSENAGLGVMRLVARRDAATIIQYWCKSGTITYSDEWAGYGTVHSLSNISQHETVNHSLHFVDPETGVHTQNIKSVLEQC